VASFGTDLTKESKAFHAVCAQLLVGQSIENRHRCARALKTDIGIAVNVGIKTVTGKTVEART
jgi:hypothetical protein